MWTESNKKLAHCHLFAFLLDLVFWICASSDIHFIVQTNYAELLASYQMDIAKIFIECHWTDLAWKLRLFLHQTLSTASFGRWANYLNGQRTFQTPKNILAKYGKLTTSRVENYSFGKRFRKKKAKRSAFWINLFINRGKMPNSQREKEQNFFFVE